MLLVFLIIFGLALSVWMAKHLYALYYFRKRRESINKLDARTATLRMLLRSKLKRKGSQIQDQYKNDAEFLKTVMPKLELLGTFNFGRSSDYEDVLEILTSLSHAIDMQRTAHDHIAQQQVKEGIEEQSKPDSNQGSQYGRWLQLLKYDKGNLYIIKEIVENTRELKIKIEVFNIEQDKRGLRLREPELIEINGFENLKALVDMDQQKSKELKDEVKNAKNNSNIAA